MKKKTKQTKPKKQTSNMPEWMTTVTPFSKLMALVTVVVIAYVAFSLGRYYQEVSTLDFFEYCSMVVDKQ